MAITIELRQTRTVVADDSFQVQTEVLTATDIIPEIFVMRTSDDVLMHVATVSDLTNLPRTKQEALDNQTERYLADTATASYETVEIAVYAATYTRDRIKHLVTTYAEYTTEFSGQDDYTITPETT